MKKLLALVFLAAISTLAQTPAVHRSPIARVGHYIGTHKRLLISDALIIGAEAADAASTRHCLDISPDCTEGNRILGRRPSNAALWGYSMGFAVFIVGCDHGAWALFGRENDKKRWLIFTNSAPITIAGYYWTRDNVNVAERLQAARLRIAP